MHSFTHLLGAKLITDLSATFSPVSRSLSRIVSPLSTIILPLRRQSLISGKSGDLTSTSPTFGACSLSSKHQRYVFFLLATDRMAYSRQVDRNQSQANSAIPQQPAWDDFVTSVFPVNGARRPGRFSPPRPDSPRSAAVLTGVHNEEEDGDEGIGASFSLQTAEASGATAPDGGDQSRSVTETTSEEFADRLSSFPRPNRRPRSDNGGMSRPGEFNGNDPVGPSSRTIPPSAGLRAVNPDSENRRQRPIITHPTDAFYNGLGSYPAPLMVPGQKASTKSSSSSKERDQRDSNGNRPKSSVPNVDDSVSSFLAEMPTSTEDSTRHVFWTELIRLKTRTLELQIAEARQKEREAEVELIKLKTGAEQRTGSNSTAVRAELSLFNGAPQEAGPVSAAATNEFSALGTYPLITHARPPLEAGQTAEQPTSAIPSHLSGAIHETAQTPMTPFDLEAMMQDSNLDSLFAWLPDFGDTAQQTASHPTAMDPLDLLSTMQNPVAPTRNLTYNHLAPKSLLFNSDPPTTAKPRRSSSASASSSSPPPAKRTKRGIEKKVIVEQPSACLTCSNPIARILIRAPKSQIPTTISPEYRCRSCKSVDGPASLPDPATMGTSIGTVDMRKRMRAQMEVEDEEVDAEARRAFCDVCQGIVGSGQIVGGKQKEPMGHMAEVICTACDSKYRR